MEFSHLSLQVGSGLFGHQVFDLIGGLFLSLIGTAILYTLASWRLRGLQVDGEVIGFRRRGPSFHGVYRYAAPGGGWCEATSVQGRSTPQDLATGRHATIQVMPGKPDEARERHAPLLWSLAVASLSSGAWLIVVGATVSTRSPLVWLLIVLAMAFTARWLWRRVSALLASMQPIAAPDPWAALPIEHAEAFGRSSPTAIEMRGAGRRVHRTGYLFVVLGLGVLALDCREARGLLELRHGTRTSGQVIELSEGATGRSGDTFLFPVVQYTGQDGRSVRFHDRTGARPSPFQVGDTVPVLFVPGRPDTATIDRGWSDWEPPAALAVMGVMLTGMGLFAVSRK